MCTPKGQPRKPETILEFQFIDTDKHEPFAEVETAEQKAQRLVGKLRGLLRDEIASFGGTDAFMRWVRSDDDEEDR